ncbi:DEAD/DEAH box helicase [Actinokineospora diospyrosa]|uniref:Superfamily II DNA and RNA helicase n=1 Tax=Actinokineospora diospyrosa TaxID=103728 RepID=A0ABT1ICZ0_9PSEU|nr:DEAD/DEAH box helicase [Actinokineospora diospyrosa]MCP2270211.1 Superfamily II DNA and RNA helicase [Actinokineospora diospyrosa]
MAARRPSKTSPTTTDDTTAGRTFAQLGVPAALVDVLSARGISTPFPIQTATLPDSLSGRDVLGRGRTGSGKTYAFALPLLARLAASTRPRRPGKPRALILAPTRELADQIAATVAPLAEALALTTTTIYGGVRPGPQVAALRAGVDVLIACPGRLADHISTGRAHLDDVEVTVLDEADHMADLGFLPVVTKLLDKTPRGSQRLLFSATLDAGVDVLVRRFLSNPATHSTDPPSAPVTAMTHHVLHVQPAARLPVLVDLVAAPGRTVVFTRTKRGATKLTRQLVAEGVPAVELHGDLGQTARTRNLLAFTDGKVTTLVATDIAARGIHVDDVALVIHADPPVEHKAYLHRSGRTARAGAAGTVITLMTDAQVADVRDLTRKAGVTATITRLRPGHPLLAELAPGERTFVAPTAKPAATQSTRNPRKPANAKRRQGPSTPKQSRSTAPAAPEAPVKTAGVAAFSAGTRSGARRRGR